MIKKKWKSNVSAVAAFIAVFWISSMILNYPKVDLGILPRLNGPLSPLDEDLIQITLQKFLHPPSEKSYNLQLKKSEYLKESFLRRHKTYKSWNAIYETLQKLYPLKNKVNGFFVEAGAYDGENYSNTLYLELEHGWSGLLVEPSTPNVKSIMTKNRKAWVCPCCLATKSYPYKTIIQNLVEKNDLTLSAMSSLIGTESNIERTDLANHFYEQIQCLPLHTLLKALNRSHVDVISLDVEDVEVPILENFPWNEISVDIWIVEHRHPQNKLLVKKDKEDPKFIEWFSQKGYVLYRVFVSHVTDYVFIRKESDFYMQNKLRLGLNK